MELRDYQIDCLDAIQKALVRGLQRLLVVLPTGTGKTVIFSHLIQQRPGRALVLAHRDELIEQAVEKIVLVAPGSNIGIVKGSRNETTPRIIVASIQTISRERRLEQLPRDFSTIIVDEAHHAAAQTYRRVLTELGAFPKDGPLTVGFTATADRGDKKGLDAIFQEIPFTCGILQMIRAGYLSDIHAVQLRLHVDFRKVHTRHGDFVDTEVEDLLVSANIEKYGVEAYQTHASERKALLFVPTVQLAHSMAAAFNRAGVAAAAIDGTTEGDIRRKILRRFKAGEIRVLANCMILTEGFDEPSVDCILMARPTQSRPLYQQIIGRGLRLHPDKDDCLVLDFVGVTGTHDLVTTASLFGVKPKTGQTVLEAIEEAEATERYRERIGADRGRLIAEAVDIFKRARLHWIRAGDCFSLSIGAGMILLKPDADSEKWTATVHYNSRHQEVIARTMPLDYAQGVAEDFARTQGIPLFFTRDADWRKKPASPGQLYRLRKMKVEFSSSINRGEASDLITQKLAESYTHTT